MDGFSRMLAVEGSRQRRWNWMPATALLMEDGCNFLDAVDYKSTYTGYINVLW